MRATIRRRGTMVTVGALLGVFSTALATADAVKSKPAATSTQSRFATFTQKLNVEGEDDFVRPNIAPFLALKPRAPSKAYVVDTLTRENDRQPEKICSLVLEQSDLSLRPKPLCALLINGSIGDDASTSHYFKVSLDGKLLTAIRITGKRAEGKAVRGSGVKTDLDINSPEVQASFKKELDFWLSGRYKKYWKPKPGVKTAQN